MIFSYHQKLENSNIGQYGEINWNPCAQLVECKMVQLLWKTAWWLLKTLKPPYDPTSPLLGMYPKELKLESWRDMCISMLIAVIFTTAKRWKQLECPFTDKWINRTWQTHKTEYYSALERKESMAHATTRMNLEDMMPSEISQSHKGKYCMSPFKWGTWSSQIHRQRVEWWLSDVGTVCSCSVGMGFSFARWNSSRDWFHNNVNVLNARERNKWS